MATTNHLSDTIHGLLRFPDHLKGQVIEIAKEIQAQAKKDHLDIWVVCCGTEQWGINFLYRFDGTKPSYRQIVDGIIGVAKQHSSNVHWSISNDVVEII
jgi:hypothetical protein